MYDHRNLNSIVMIERGEDCLFKTQDNQESAFKVRSFRGFGEADTKHPSLTVVGEGSSLDR